MVQKSWLHGAAGYKRSIGLVLCVCCIIYNALFDIGAWLFCLALAEVGWIVDGDGSACGC